MKTRCLLFLFLSVFACCEGAPPPPVDDHGTELRGKGWTPAARVALGELAAEFRGRGELVVFDFDNTVLRGDIGEATFETLVRSGDLDPSKIPAGLLPTAEKISTGEGLLAYYEGLKELSSHGPAYLWVVQIMAGLSPAQITRATEMAFSKQDFGDASQPCFYEGSVELIGMLLNHGFDVRIVSASNVWSVRWVVTQRLNPLLRRRGLEGSVKGEHVVGISLLVHGEDKKLHEDEVLVAEDGPYAKSDAGHLASLSLSGLCGLPVPTYEGKAAVIARRFKRQPLLVVGDSPNDFAMLREAHNKLWLARVDKPAYLHAALELRSKTAPESWVVQPVYSGPEPGYVPSATALESKAAWEADDGRLRQSVLLLKEGGMID